jgi:uncharacterized protein
MRTILAGALVALCVASTAWADAAGDLLKAAQEGDGAKVEAALGAGAAPDSRGERRATALMLAAQSGSLPAVRALLARGADVRATRDDDVTALHHAAAAASPDVVAALLDAGASIDAATVQGSSAVRVALVAKNFAVAEALLDRGATLAGTTPALAQALQPARLLAPVAPLLTRGLAERLIAAGGDPATATGGLNARLFAAAQQHQPEAAALLLSRGADANAVGERGVTPLLAASTQNDFEQRIRGLGALLLISGQGGTDPRTFTRSMLGSAAQNPLMRSVGLENAYAGLAQLSTRRAATLRVLLDAGANVKAVNSQGETALNELAQSYDGASVAMLLAAGGDGLAAPTGRQPPLHVAAKGAYLPVVEALLAAKVDPNAANSKGQTPLMTAAMGGGDTDTVRMLLVAGADVKARDAGGHTALHYAAGAEEDIIMQRATDNPQMAAVVTLLLEAGADPAARNSAGKTPREVARMPKYAAAARLLRDAER